MKKSKIIEYILKEIECLDEKMDYDISMSSTRKQLKYVKLDFNIRDRTDLKDE